MDMKEIGGIRLPDTPLCQAATQLARSLSAPFLFHHVMRSCVYAEMIGQRRKAAYDSEVLYVATVLHDLGLTSVAPVRARFELEGADAAKEFLAKQGMDDPTAELVWDAIALHTTSEIPLRKRPEIALCHLGITSDFRGLPADVVAGAPAARVLDVYPELDLKEGLLAALTGLYRKNPAAAASHAVADACERHVPGFRRFNLCDVLAAAKPARASEP
jgi:hypothetical protein